MSAPEDPAAVVVSVTLPPEVIDEITRRVRDEVLAELRVASPEPAGYLAPAAAAAYLGVPKKRVYDLTSARALMPDGRDGRTPLYKRETLDRYAQSMGS